MYAEILEEHARLSHEKSINGSDMIKTEVEALILAIEKAFRNGDVDAGNLTTLSRINAMWRVELATSAPEHNRVRDIEYVSAKKVVNSLTIGQWWKIFGALAIIGSGSYYLARLATSFDVKDKELQLSTATARLNNEISKTELLEKRLEIKNDNMSSLTLELSKCKADLEDRQQRLDKCVVQPESSKTQP